MLTRDEIADALVAASLALLALGHRHAATDARVAYGEVSRMRPPAALLAHARTMRALALSAARRGGAEQARAYWTVRRLLEAAARLG